MANSKKLRNRAKGRGVKSASAVNALTAKTQTDQPTYARTRLAAAIKVVSLVSAGVVGGLATIPEGHAQELPGTYTVQGGAVAITHPDGTVINANTPDPTNASLLITQTTTKAAIDWNTYGVGAGQSVLYEMNDTMVSLNRVTGNATSNIHGNILSGAFDYSTPSAPVLVNPQGTVFLVNPNGVIFHNTAFVNVGSIVASTMDINANDFMNSGDTDSLVMSGIGGLVQNDGVINASTGTVVLAGGRVVNNGTVIGRVRVDMAAGNGATIDFFGDGLMQFEITDFEITQGIDGTTLSPGESAVHNAVGANVIAGDIILSAKAATEVFDSLVKNDGRLVATTVVDSAAGNAILANGNVTLDAIGSNVAGGVDNEVENTGEIFANGDVSLSGEGIDHSGSISGFDLAGFEIDAGATDVTLLNVDAVAGTVEGFVVGDQSITADTVTATTGQNVTMTSTGELVDGAGVGSGTAIAYTGSTSAASLNLSGDGDINVTTSGSDFAQTGDIAATGSVAITADNIQLAGGQTLSAGDDLTLDATVGDVTDDGSGVALSAGSDVSITSDTFDQFGTIDAGDSIAITTTGDLIHSQDITATNGDITLTSTAGGIEQSSGAIANATAGAVTFDADSALTATSVGIRQDGTIVAASADFQATPATDIDQSSGAVLTVAGLVEMNGDSISLAGTTTAGGADIDAGTAYSQTGSLSVSGAATIDAGSIDQNGTIDADTSLAMTANNGVLLQNGAINSLNGGSGSVTLSNTSSTVAGGVAITQGDTIQGTDVALTTTTNFGNIELSGGISASGDLVVSSTRGNVIDDGSGVNISAGNDVVIESNSFSQFGTIDAGDSIAITTTGDLVHSQDITATNGSITLASAAGGITQSAGATASAASGTVTFDADGSLLGTTVGIQQDGTIIASATELLATPTTDVNQTGSISGGAVNIGGQIITQAVGASIIGTSLEMNADSVNLAGDTTVDAADIDAIAGAFNQTGGSLDVAGDITILAGSIDQNGTIDAGTSLAMTATNGALLQNGAINSLNGGAGSVTLSNTSSLVSGNLAIEQGDTIQGTDVTLTTTTNFGNIAVSGGIAASNDLTLTSTRGSVIAGGGSGDLTSNGGDVIINSTSFNQFGTIVADGSVAITSASDLTHSQNITATNGNITLVSTGGGITQSAGATASATSGTVIFDAGGVLSGSTSIQQDGTIVAAVTSLQAAPLMDIYQTGTIMGGSVNMSGRNIFVPISSVIDVTGSVDVDGALAVELSGDISAGGSVDIDAPMYVNQHGQIDAASVAISTDLLTQHGSINATGNVYLDAVSFNQDGSGSIHGGAITIYGDLYADVGGSLTGISADISSAGVLRSFATIDLTGALLMSGSSVELSGNVTAGSADIDAVAAFDQLSGSLTVSNAATILAGSIEQYGAIDAGTSLVMTATNGTLVQNGVINSNNGGTGSVLLSNTSSTVAGDVAITQGNVIHGTDVALTTTADDGNIEVSGSINASGDLTLSSTRGEVVDDGSGVNLSAGGDVAITSLSFDQFGAINAGGSVTITSINDLIHSRDITATSGNITLYSSAGGIHQTSSATASAMSGTVTFDVEDGTLFGSSPAVGIQQDGIINASSIVLNASSLNSINLTGSISGGSLSLDAANIFVSNTATINLTGSAIIDSFKFDYRGQMMIGGLLDIYSVYLTQDGQISAGQVDILTDVYGQTGSIVASDFVYIDAVTFGSSGAISGNDVILLGNFEATIDGTVSGNSVILYGDYSLDSGGNVNVSNSLIMAGDEVNLDGVYTAGTIDVQAGFSGLTMSGLLTAETVNLSSQGDIVSTKSFDENNVNSSSNLPVLQCNQCNLFAANAIGVDTNNGDVSNSIYILPYPGSDQNFLNLATGNPAINIEIAAPFATALVEGGATINDAFRGLQLRTAIENNTSLDDIGNIDWSVVSVDLNLFGVVEPGIRLPEDQLEDFVFNQEVPEPDRQLLVFTSEGWHYQSGFELNRGEELY